ncbi:MAG: ABC transporter related protein, partial [Parcubacteria group bacterium GW2011_GWA2_56_7]
GERTKLSLMLLLGSEPDVLLLDEPTNHLDLESVSKLAGLFDTYRRAGAALVSVSHVEWFLDMVSTDGTLELVQGPKERKLVASKSPFADYKKREQSKPATREKITWRASQPKGASIFRMPEVLTIPDSPIAGVRPPLFFPGELHVLSGKNGTGKTKLLKTLADPHSRIIDREPGTQSAFLPQMWPPEVLGSTVETFFGWVRDEVNPHTVATFEMFKRELKRVGLLNDAHGLRRPFNSLSGGEQRLAWFVAAGMMEGTDVLLLDEPSNHMDASTMDAVAEAIRSFPGTIVLSTHDVRLMRALESFAGSSREGRPPRNVVLSRANNRTTFSVAKESPSSYARGTIEAAMKSAGRLKVT